MRIASLGRASAKRPAAAARLIPLLRELKPADQQLAVEMYQLKHESGTEALIATVLTYGVVLVITVVADAAGMATVGIPASFNAPAGAAGLTLLHWIRWLRPTLRAKRARLRQLAELRPDLAEAVRRAVIGPPDFERSTL